jgi:hypothetical protein
VIIGGNGLTESQPSLSIKALNSQRIILNRARAGESDAAVSVNLRMMQHQLGLFCQFNI